MAYADVSKVLAGTGLGLTQHILYGQVFLTEMYRLWEDKHQHPNKYDPDDTRSAAIIVQAVVDVLKKPYPATLDNPHMVSKLVRPDSPFEKLQMNLDRL